METYIVRINGVEYEVEIEKKDSVGVSAAPVAAKKEPVKASSPKAAAPAGKADGQPAVCGTAGKVWKVERAVGDEVKTGDPVVIIEAMKMEIPVVAPVDGKVLQITVSEGDSVASGQTVAYVG